MKSFRTLPSIALLVVCSLATLAHAKDPKIIIHGTSGGGAPTVMCPPEGCTPVGVDFSFTIRHNGSPPLTFTNVSGQDWISLTLTESGVPAADVTCAQTLYLTCTVTAQPDGSTQIVLAGVKGLNPRNGILAGASFSIGFACVNRVCWPRGLNFTAHATTSFQTVDFPGAVSTYVYGINNAGQMVGAYIDGYQVTHGFLLSNGIFTTIDYPGSTLSVASGINNNGAITGQYNDSEGIGHGFVFSGNEFGTHDIGSGYQTYPTAIDDFGDLVGFCIDTGGTYHGCVEFDGFSLLDYPGATASLALGVNFQNSSIVGGFGNVNGFNFEHGFLYQDGSFTQIDFSDSVQTVAFGINDNGQIVGTYSTPPAGPTNGFSLVAGSFSTINIPGALQTNPVNLNDVGQIVGWYVDSSNVTHGYVSTQ